MIVVFIGAALLANRGDATPASGKALRLGTAILGSGDLSVLNSPTSLYAPSKRTLEMQAGHSMLRDARDLRFADASGTARVFVAPGTSSASVCLIVEDAAGPSTAIDCAPKSVLQRGAILLLKPDGRQTVDVFALVGDGVTSVGSASVRNNVAVLRAFGGRVIELRNTAGDVSRVAI